METTELPVIEVARELQQPLEDLARTLDQPPARIVNQALAEFIERRLRPDRNTSGSTASYIEMTAREEHHDVF
jgi:predicted transcriptional regulator